MQDFEIIVNNDTLRNLYNRAMLAVEDGHFDEARAQIDKMLDIDARFYGAYLVGLLCNLGLKDVSRLYDAGRGYNEYENYRKLIQFAPDKHKEEFKKANEINNKNTLYNTVKANYNLIDNDEVYEVVEEALEKLAELGYKDSEQLLDNMVDKHDEILKNKIENSNNIDTLKELPHKIYDDKLKNKMTAYAEEKAKKLYVDYCEEICSRAQATFAHDKKNTYAIESAKKDLEKIIDYPPAKELLLKMKKSALPKSAYLLLLVPPIGWVAFAIWYIKNSL